MEECHEILKFLKSKIPIEKIGVTEITRTYQAGEEFTNHLDYGALYCYAINLSDENKNLVFESMKDMPGKNKSLTLVDQWNPIAKTDDEKLYPLYIGESESLGSRIKSHISYYKGNWSIHLTETSDEIKKHNIYFATVSTSQSNEERLKTENEINKEFPSLLQTYAPPESKE